MADQNNTGALLDATVRRMHWALATLIVAVTAGAFIQSYRQLFDWASRHRVPLWIAPEWPLMLDAFAIIGEIVLFIAIVKRWPNTVRWIAGLVAAAGLSISIVAQWFYLPAGVPVADRGTAIVAPVAAGLGLALGLLVLELVAAQAAKPKRVTVATVSTDEVGARRRTQAAERSRRYRQNKRGQR